MFISFIFPNKIRNKSIDSNVVVVVFFLEKSKTNTQTYKTKIVYCFFSNQHFTLIILAVIIIAIIAIVCLRFR